MKTITASTLKKRISGKKMLIDTNIIICLTDIIQPYEPLSRLIFNMIEMGDSSAVLSIVSVAEVMQVPIKKKDTTGMLRMLKIIFSIFQIFPARK